MLRALVRRLGPTRFLFRAGPLLVPADRLVSRLTGGRVVALGLIPSALLTSTGRRTGQPRHSPLLCLEDGDAFLVIGSNWGKPGHPAWALNLLAEPRATLTRGGERIPVKARLVSGAERERLWRKAVEAWPGYATYEKRAAGRAIHVFLLER